MFHIVLVAPEIPPNTGNVIRLAANTGCTLHLVEPLGFLMEDKLLRRAGLDYHEWVEVRTYADLGEFMHKIAPGRLLAFSTHASQCYTQVDYRADDALLFGPETRGLPKEILESVPAAQRLTLPMQPDSRSLNLSNTVAIAVYEAWRQLGFAGAVGAGISA